MSNENKTVNQELLSCPFNIETVEKMIRHIRVSTISRLSVQMGKLMGDFSNDSIVQDIDKAIYQIEEIKKSIQPVNHNVWHEPTELPEQMDSVILVANGRTYDLYQVNDDLITDWVEGFVPCDKWCDIEKLINSTAPVNDTAIKALHDCYKIIQEQERYDSYNG